MQPAPVQPFFYRCVLAVSVYLSAWAMVIVDIKNMTLLAPNRPEGAQIFGKIRSHDLVIAMGMGIGLLLLPRLMQTLRWKPVLIGLGVMAYLTVLGFIRTGGGSVAMNDDVRIWLMFFVGIIWCRAILELRNPGFHIAVLGVASACMMWGAVVLSPEFLGFSNFSGERVFDPIVFNFSALSLVFMGICIVHSAGRGGFVPLAAALFIVFTELYVGAGLAATRSIAISTGAGAGIALLFASRLRPPRGTVIDPRVISWLGVITLGAMAFLLVNWSQVYQLFQLITSRTTEDSGSADNITSRTGEVVDLLGSLSLDEYIIGPGFGRRFPSRIYNYLTAAEVHIGIFTFLLKGGAILFLTLVYLILIKGPMVALRGMLASPEQRRSVERNALYALAGFYGCASLLFMSGGYTVYCTLGYGFAVGLLLSKSRSELAPRTF